MKLFRDKFNDNKKITSVYFDLDETLVSKIMLNNGEYDDFVRPVAKILFDELRKRGIQIGILTTRGSEYIPDEIKRYVGGEIIGRDEGEQYRGQCFERFGFENTPFDAKECFVKIKKESQDTLIVDDTPYAQRYENCLYVDDRAKFFI